MVKAKHGLEQFHQAWFYLVKHEGLEFHRWDGAKVLGEVDPATTLGGGCNGEVYGRVGEGNNGCSV